MKQQPPGLSYSQASLSGPELSPTSSPSHPKTNKNMGLPGCCHPHLTDMSWVGPRGSSGQAERRKGVITLGGVFHPIHPSTHTQTPPGPKHEGLLNVPDQVPPVTWLKVFILIFQMVKPKWEHSLGYVAEGQV